MSFRIRTIQDMERAYYDSSINHLFTKVDAPIISTTTGVYNAVYGALVWAQFNQEANVWGVLPKVPFEKSGWRVFTARAGATADGRVAENGAVPDSIKPTWEEVSTKPGTTAHVFNVSEVQNFLASTENGDDATGNTEQNKMWMGAKHREAINQQLVADVDAVVTTGFQSIDRVCSSQSEESAILDAGDADIYGIDRSAVTWADAQVDHNSGTDRVLTDKLIRDTIADVKNAGGNTTVIITGWDTYSAIQGLYDSQVRYNPLGQTKIKLSVNGIETQTGFDVGLTVASLYDIPMIISKDIVKDTISRIYFLDTSDAEGFGEPRLSFDVAKPTQYFEAGMSTGDPFGIDKLADEGMYRTMGELKCRFFAAQGKIRDLK